MPSRVDKRGEFILNPTAVETAGADFKDGICLGVEACGFEVQCYDGYHIRTSMSVNLFEGLLDMLEKFED